MNTVHWAGSSLNDLKAFSAEAKQDAGYQIHRLQIGRESNDCKSMKTVGSGAREIRTTTKDGAFRVIYVTVIKNQAVVLHAFQKKTQTTSKADIDLAKQRLKDARKELK